MSLIPEHVGFEEQVQAFFLAFRGSGVALSPLDADVLIEWKERGVPYPVVCRGIRKSAEAVAHDARPEDSRLRSLRSCRKAVESEFRRFQGRAVGRGEAADRTPAQVAERRRKAAIAKVRKAMRIAPGPEHARALNAALTALATASEGPEAVSHAIARAEDSMALTYVRALPLAARRAILREAKVNAGPRPVGVTPRARRDALRAHLVAVVRTRGALVGLV
jgi:hypothetical protein